MRALIVEDERRLARNIARVLETEASFAVDVSTDGEDGRHMALSETYDLIVLDLMLPTVDGMTILRHLRAAGRDTPVLILTARDATEDIVRCLDLGCDDYLTKPFDMQELVARCRAMVRRAYHQPNPWLELGPLRINTASRQVELRGEIVALAPMEYRLLEYLARRAGEVVSKEELIEHLYDSDAERFSNVLEVYVSVLRKRLGRDVIRTVRGMGYVLGELEP